MHDDCSQHPAVDSFTTAVLDMFGNEPWALAEPYIERAWALQRTGGHPAWPEIRDDIERAWALQRLEEDQGWSEIRDAVRLEWLGAVTAESVIGTGELLP
jgi:hypothetical protein